MDNSASSLNSLLQRQNRGALPGTRHAPELASTKDEEYQAYAKGRVGNKAQLTLIFRKADGSVRAFTYTHLFSIVAQDSATGFEVTFSRERITIKGHNLAELFRFLCEHRVSEIAEADRSEALSTNGEPIVETILFRDAAG
jgi:hypothetical protein